MKAQEFLEGRGYTLARIDRQGPVAWYRRGDEVVRQSEALEREWAAMQPKPKKPTLRLVGGKNED